VTLNITNYFKTYLKSNLCYMSYLLNYFVMVIRYVRLACHHPGVIIVFLHDSRSLREVSGPLPWPRRPYSDDGAGIDEHVLSDTVIFLPNHGQTDIVDYRF